MLRGHSSCVLTDRPMREREALGNCRWTRHLDDSDAQPEGWPALASWERFAPRWRAMRGFVRQLVLCSRAGARARAGRAPSTRTRGEARWTTRVLSSTGSCPWCATAPSTRAIATRPCVAARIRPLSGIPMDRTITQLEAAHARLRDAFEAQPTPASEVLARCVPQLVGLIEDRVPNADAVILRREDVREMCLSLVLDVLEVQTAVARPRKRVGRPLTIAYVVSRRYP